MLIKSPDTAISLHEGPFPAKGNLVCGGGLIYGDFDRWRALMVEHLSVRDSMKGSLGEGSFTGERERRGF
jgi:hypothetical protein